MNFQRGGANRPRENPTVRKCMVIRVFEDCVITPPLEEENDIDLIDTIVTAIGDRTDDNEVPT